MRRSEIAAAVKEERRKLLSDLRVIDRDAWDAQSLCEEWRVRDAVGHLIRLGDYYRGAHRSVLELMRCGFRLNRALSVAAQHVGTASPDQLLEQLDRARYEQTFVFRVHPQPLFALAEWIVHGQDIRRPLGLTASFDTTALVAIADISTNWYTWGGRQRRRQERLEATDADWATGEGPPVLRGPMEAVVMVLFGRESAMADLVQQ